MRVGIPTYASQDVSASNPTRENWYNIEGRGVFDYSNDTAVDAIINALHRHKNILSTSS